MGIENYVMEVQKNQIISLILNGELREGHTIRVPKNISFYHNNPIKKCPDDPKYDELTLTKQVIDKIME